MKKGNLLEDALEYIERKITESNPSLKLADILIERKKILIIDGVRNEIDLYVTVDPGNGYKSIFIFECKNWDKKVNKNEITPFSEKIRDTQSQTGFFLAKSFTKDALNKAKLDKRLKLQIVTDEALSMEAITETYTVYKEHFVNDISIRALNKDDQDKMIQSMNLVQGKVITHNGNLIQFDKFISNIIDIKIAEKVQTISSSSENIYDFSFPIFQTFENNTLNFNGYEIYSILFVLNLKIYIIKGEIIYGFKIQGRGKVARKKFSLPNGQLLEIVYTEADK